MTKKFKTNAQAAIAAFNWIRQGISKDSTRYPGMLGVKFCHDTKKLITTNGSVCLRAELPPSAEEQLSLLLSPDDILMYPKGKLAQTDHEIKKLDKDHLSIYGNIFKINQERFPKTQMLFDAVRKYDKFEKLMPRLDPHYLNFFYDKFPSNSDVRNSDTVPTVLIPPNGEIGSVYLETYTFGFRAEGVINPIVFR